jgi:hypothetical protein
VDFHPRRAEPRLLAHPVKNNLRGPRIAYTGVRSSPTQCLPLVLPQHPDEHGPQDPVLSSRSIRSSAKARLSGQPQNSPIRSARSKSRSMRTWSSSARGAGPSASRRSAPGVGARARRDATALKP